MDFVVRGCEYVLRLPRKVRWKYIQKKDTNDPVIATLDNGLRARIYPNDTLGELVYVCGGSEKSERKFVSRYLQKGMVFFDVGANFGQYTLLASVLVGQTGQVHSFEPSQRLFRELEYNVSLNSFEKRCHLNNIALSDTSGTAELMKYQPGAEVFGSLGNHQRKEAVATGTETVQTTTLDIYVKESGIPYVDLLKMDIEGAELLALKGGHELFSREDAPALLIELADENCIGFPYRASDIWDYLVNAGYAIYVINDNGKVLPADKPTDEINSDYVALKGVAPERICG